MEISYNMTLVMWCHQNQHHMIPMALPVAQHTDARTSTSTETNKSSNLNVLNKRNAMASLMVPLASCHNKHAIAMYVPKLICPSNATYMSHVPISSCTHETMLSAYIWTQYNQHRDQEHWYTYILHYCHMPLNKYDCEISCVPNCTNSVVYIQTPHYYIYKSK